MATVRTEVICSTRNSTKFQKQAVCLARILSIRGHSFAETTKSTHTDTKMRTRTFITLSVSSGLRNDCMKYKNLKVIRYRYS